MTSAKKGGGGFRSAANLRTNRTYFAGREGGGVKRSQNSVDVIYGSPLAVPSFHPSFPFLPPLFCRSFVGRHFSVALRALNT